MASNKQIKTRAAEQKVRGDKKFDKVLTDIHGVLGTGEELPNHFTPRGQSFTRPATK